MLGIVLFDHELMEYLRARLPMAIKIILFRDPNIPLSGGSTRPQLARMYREASDLTVQCTEVWVIGRSSGSFGRNRAARFAEGVASMLRRPVLRDSLDTLRGKLQFSRWVDQPGGVARRAEMARTRAWAESVLVVGAPKRTPITRPFSSSELRIDSDTLWFYLARLPDTSFYSIGGCSDVELVNWTAAEKLGSMGPGVVPVLVDRIADPSPFVRERVQEALLYATQDERILARSGGEYIKFYDRPSTRAEEIVRAWWAKFGGFWASADTIQHRRR